MGVATQCLKSSKCNRAKIQYWANVMLKCAFFFSMILISLVLMRRRVNVKLDGINAVLDGSSIHDPANPTIVMGKQAIFDLIFSAKCEE